MEQIKETAAIVRQRLLDQLQRDEPAAAIRSTSRSSGECPQCGGSGNKLIAGGVKRCQCVAEAIKRKIPERFRGCTFANYTAKTDVLAERCRALEKEPTQSVFLFGDYGAGKTHLAVAQYNALVDVGVSVLFFTMPELLRELRKAELDSEYVSIVVDRVRYANAFHLFIDDVDKYKVTLFKFEALYDLLNTVYNRKLGLTVTSNYSLKELVDYEKLSPAIVRRIDEMCEAWSVTAGVLRQIV